MNQSNEVLQQQQQVPRSGSGAHTSRTVIVAAIAATAAVAPLSAQRAPVVDVWFEGGNELARGDASSLHYDADRGSYVAVLRADAQGRISVLAPTRPNIRSEFAPGANDAETLRFRADPYDGVGYVFAIASRAPFDFRKYRTSDGRWQMGTLSQRQGVDPFEAVDRFARVVTGRNGNYSVAYAPYRIGRGPAPRGGDHHGVVYDPVGGYGGYGGDGNYGNYGGYPDGYGYSDGYGDRWGDRWGDSPYRRRFDDDRYDAYRRYDRHRRSGRIVDPRARYDRHCPDGTLVPYTVPCPQRWRRERHR